MNVANKLKIILENAIKDEEYAYNLYSKFAETTEDDTLKEALLELAEQEKIHKEKLETLGFDKINAVVFPDKINALEIKHEVNLIPIEQFDTLVEMFEFAIKQEIAAKILYFRLAECSKDKIVKQMFVTLSEEESKHEEILKEKLSEIGEAYG